MFIRDLLAIVHEAFTMSFAIYYPDVYGLFFVRFRVHLTPYFVNNIYCEQMAMLSKRSDICNCWDFLYMHETVVLQEDGTFRVLVVPIRGGGVHCARIYDGLLYVSVWSEQAIQVFSL